MRRWWKRPRKIVAGGTVYRYSLLDRPEYQELRVYREGGKQPAICLRLAWPDTWAIDLFRPRAVAFVIAYYSQNGSESADALLEKDSPLFQGLLELFSSGNQ